MTKEEFEAGYIERSGITKAQYDQFNVTLACNCDDDTCDGWSAVSNNEQSIKNHNDFYI